MTLLSRGVAHLSFPGGAMLLPARTPYDREILIQHVEDRVRTEERVQVLLNDQRWLIDLVRNPCADCAHCGSGLAAACYAPGHEHGPYCVHCGLGTERDPELPVPQPKTA